MIPVQTLTRLSNLILDYNHRHKYRAARMLLMPCGFTIEMRDFTSTDLKTHTQHISFGDLTRPNSVILIEALMQAMNGWLDT